MLAVAAALWAGDVSQAYAAEPSVVSRATVFAYPSRDPYDRGNLHGFNHAPSVARLPDERLLAVWFAGPYEGSVHQVILGSYSADDGRSWSKATVLQDFPRQSDFDPALIVDGQRTWLFFSAGRWNRYPFVGDQKQNVGIDSFRIFRRHSDDSGKTWSEPVEIYHGGSGCRSNGLKLASGELILPVHHFLGKSAGVLRSADAGQTWQRHGDISTSTKAAEPSVAELKSGKLLMALRTSDGWLWTATSDDRGETWSQAEKTEVNASYASHSLLALGDGRLALVHNDCPTPLRTKLTLRLSSDEGTTWNKPITLAEAAPPDETVWSRQVTYPSMVELPDGTLLVVWAAISISNEEQFGTIESVRIRPGKGRQR